MVKLIVRGAWLLGLFFSYSVNQIGRFYCSLYLGYYQAFDKWVMFKDSKNKVETIIKTGDESQVSCLDGPQRLKECSFIVTVLASILLSVALLTFSPADPVLVADHMEKIFTMLEALWVHGLQIPYFSPLVH